MCGAIPPLLQTSLRVLSLRKDLIYVRFEVSAAVTIYTVVFWDMTPCSLVDGMRTAAPCCENLI
jgi:hypothetical protein